MHVGNDPVDFGLLGLDLLAALRLGGPAGVIFRAGLITVALRLEAWGELFPTDRTADEPHEPGERVALVGRVDVDAQRGAVFVDELQDLSDCPPALDEPFPSDDAAHLADVAAANPAEICSAVGELNDYSARCAASCPEQPGEPSDEFGGEVLDSGLPARQGTGQIEHFI